MAFAAHEDALTVFAARAKVAKQAKRDASTIAHTGHADEDAPKAKKRVEWDLAEDLRGRVC